MYVVLWFSKMYGCTTHTKCITHKGYKGITHQSQVLVVVVVVIRPQLRPMLEVMPLQVVRLIALDLIVVVQVLCLMGTAAYSPESLSLSHCSWVTHSLVPRPIPSFSMLHAEKREGLVREITCVTPSQHNAASTKGRLWKLPVLSYRI